MVKITLRELEDDPKLSGPYTFRKGSAISHTISRDVPNGPGDTKKLGNVISSEDGLTRKQILTDINRFQFNVRNIFISPYKNLRSGEIGKLDTTRNSNDQHIGPDSYYNTATDSNLGKGAEYIPKGMENWYTGSDKGRRLREGNFGLQLDISKGWVSIFGKDDNTESEVQLYRGSSTPSSTDGYNRPAPGTYNHIAVVLNKWHKVGVEMNIGDFSLGLNPNPLTFTDDIETQATGTQDPKTWRVSDIFEAPNLAASSLASWKTRLIAAGTLSSGSTETKDIVLGYALYFWNLVRDTDFTTTYSLDKTDGTWDDSSNPVVYGINQSGNAAGTDGEDHAGKNSTDLLGGGGGAGKVTLGKLQYILWWKDGSYGSQIFQVPRWDYVADGYPSPVHLLTRVLVKLKAAAQATGEAATYEFAVSDFLTEFGINRNENEKLVTSGDLTREQEYGTFSNYDSVGNPWGDGSDYDKNGANVNLTYDAAIKNPSEYISYKYRIAQKFEKIKGKVTADHSGLTMANNTFSNRDFTGEQVFKYICNGTVSGNKLNCASSDAIGGTSAVPLENGNCVIFIVDTNMPAGSQIPELKNGGTYFVVDNSTGAVELSTTRGGPAISLTNGKGSDKDYLIKHSGFRKELSEYPTGSKDIGCMFLAREKFRHYLTKDVTSHGGLNFAYRHNIPIGTALKYTDNSVATIPELVSGNTYYVVKNTSGLTEGNPNGRGAEYDNSGGAKAKHIMISAEKNGEPIKIADGGGAANNKFRELRPTAYEELKYVDDQYKDQEVYFDKVQTSTHSSDILENMYFEPLVLVKKLNPPLVITNKTKDVKFNWKMSGAGAISLYKESLGGADWITNLDDDSKVQGQGRGRGESGVVLNVDELNFSVKAI